MSDCDHKNTRSTHHCPTGVHVGVCIDCFTVTHVCSGVNPEELPKFGLPHSGDATAYVGSLQNLYYAVKDFLDGKADVAHVRDIFEYVEPEKMQLDGDPEPEKKQ